MSLCSVVGSTPPSWTHAWRQRQGLTGGHYANTPKCTYLYFKYVYVNCISKKLLRGKRTGYHKHSSKLGVPPVEPRVKLLDIKELTSYTVK